MIFAFEQEGSARGLDAPAPEIRTHEVGELPVGARFEHHDLLAGLGQDRGECRTRRARADDDNVYFFVRHVTTSASARYAPCREYRAPRSRPWCHRRRRWNRSAAPYRQ